MSMYLLMSSKNILTYLYAHLKGILKYFSKNLCITCIACKSQLSFLCLSIRDELPSGKKRKEKTSKKSSHLDIEKDDNNEYDKKPDNFDRAVIKFSEKLKLCPHQVIRLDSSSLQFFNDR